MCSKFLQSLIICLVTLSSFAYVCAKPQQTEQLGEGLLPLTEQERSLDPREIVANQPDFVADLTFFRSETVSGSGGSMRLARKGNRYREESTYWIFIGEAGKPTTRLDAIEKTYDDLGEVRDESANASGGPFNPKTLALESDIAFHALGAVMHDGLRLIKIEALRKGKPEKIFLFSAPALRNLIVVAQILNAPFGFIQTLTNVSLDVPDSLVQIPSEYKAIEHDRWTKVENARVIYNGKPSKDFGVFRAPGGELFVWVNDALYSWEYLVRPKEAKVETAFQGLLLTRSGKFIWQTDMTEAFSTTSYRTNKHRMDDTDRQVVVTSNSIKFRSNDYDKNKSVIEIRW